MLLAALVVLWFVVLVPMVVTRGDARAAPAGQDDSGRTLQRRRVADPVVHAETERVSIDRAALRSSGELRVDVHAVRRRTLAGLVALALLALGGALTYRSWVWAPQVVLDVVVVGYLLVIRAAARRARRERREAMRRMARGVPREAGPVARPAAYAAAGQARGAAPQPPGEVPQAPASVPQAPAAAWRPPVPAPLVVQLTGPYPSLPLAPVHPLRPGRVVAARSPMGAGWQDSAVVGLDDEDIGFAVVDVYRPRAASG